MGDGVACWDTHFVFEYAWGSSKDCLFVRDDAQNNLG